jgi:hypothetical protein
VYLHCWPWQGLCFDLFISHWFSTSHSSCHSSDWSKWPPTFLPGSFRRTCVRPCNSTSNLKLQSVNSAHYAEMLWKCLTCPLPKAATAAESYFRECDTQLPVVPIECQETLTQQHSVSPWNIWNLNTFVRTSNLKRICMLPGTSFYSHVSNSSDTELSLVSYSNTVCGMYSSWYINHGQHQPYRNTVSN